MTWFTRPRSQWTTYDWEEYDRSGDRMRRASNEIQGEGWGCIAGWILLGTLVVIGIVMITL